MLVTFLPTGNARAFTYFPSSVLFGEGASQNNAQSEVQNLRASRSAGIAQTEQR